MDTQLLKNRKLNYGKYLIGINVPPVRVIGWQDKSGNNNHLLAKSKNDNLFIAAFDHTFKN